MPIPLVPVSLRCEHLVDPLGVEHPQPRLSWQLSSPRRGERQSAWQVQVASSPTLLAKGRGDLWDSGRTTGDAQLAVYDGAALAARQQAWWRVRAWDAQGKAGPWSDPARWEMGLLTPKDWRGRWIARTDDPAPAPAPLLRRAFRVDGELRRARIYVCGIGYHELRLNGAKVGDRLLDPGYTRYDRRALYVVHDVTDALVHGENVIGAILGTGWYDVHTAAVWGFHQAPWRGSPRLLLQLHLDYADGRERVIVSDGKWSVATGPIVYDSIYGGESYDARLERAGWDEPGYDDRSWRTAKVVDGPGGALAAQLMPPIRARRRLEPRAITQPRPGVHVVDFGQAFAGHARIAVDAPAGTEITIRYGERLDAQGLLDTAFIDEHMTKADPAFRFQTDRFIAAGRGRQEWSARFTYHGFRWVEIHGWPGTPAPGDIVGVEHHTDLEPAGAFSCADPLLGRIALATDWAYLSNLQSIPTDCPQREKNGWTGDAHLACEQGLFTYRGAPFYEKWLDDLMDEQRPGGELPGIVPSCGWGYEWGNGPAWDSAYHLIAWTLWEHLGDARPLEKHYERLRRYVDYLGTRAVDGIVAIGLGDWCPAKTETPVEVTSTAFYHADAAIVAGAARLLGREDDARRYGELAAGIRRAFIARFRDDAGRWANGSQTALACALHFGLVDDAEREATARELVAAVDRAGGHIDCGILGTSWVLRALHAAGRDDVALRIATRTTFPGWGHWLEQGATTLWENWNGASSRNHIMFGDIVAWMFRALGGIEPDPAAPGFARVVVRPPLLAALPYASARHDSVRGRFAVDWRRAEGTMTVSLLVPANAEALLLMPTDDPQAVREGDGPAAEAESVRAEGHGAGRARFRVGAGSYRFTAPLRPTS
jgi:alpha-L-rhamnosidase